MTMTKPFTEREQQALGQMREAQPGAGINAEGLRGEDRAGRTAALRTQNTLGAQGCLRTNPARQG